MFRKKRATSSTLFVRVDTGVTENAGMENANKWQSMSNAAYNFPGSYSATDITNWATQRLGWTAFSGSLF